MIKLYLFACERIDQQFDLRFVGKINGANVNVQVWISVQQFLAQISQTFASSRDENNRARTVRELPRKFASDAGRSPRDQRVTTIEVHRMMGGRSSCDAERGLAGVRPSKDSSSRLVSARQCPRGKSPSRRRPIRIRTRCLTR